MKSPTYQALVIFFILLCISFEINAQGFEKLSPPLQNLPRKGENMILVRILIKGKVLPIILQNKEYRQQKIAEYDSVSFYKMYVTADDLVDKILKLPEVLFVDDGSRRPREEVVINNLDLAVNLISTAHNTFPQWNGNGLTFSLKENKPDTADIDLAGRYITTHLASKIISSHATNMATMITGGGNSWYLGKGAAWAANLTASDFANLLPDPVSTLQQYNISVQNHSYGVGVENFYGADASLYDASLLNNSLLHVFSSGNSGNLAATTGTYAGINGFANLTGSFKMAKNIITVGATDSFHNIVTLSSKGPAHDGRVKPELVAFGIDGSSGSAALTSGVALLIQQQYKGLYGDLPANALLKSILLNSADDRGTKEVDYANGFGSLNAIAALRNVANQRFLKGNILNGSAQLFVISVPAGLKKLKATLVWNDPPANANATKALINDLDLEMVNIATNEKWLPWVLNSYPNADSLRLPATRKRDSLNNVEQITLENPSAGTYQLIVKGYNVNAPTQNFFIAYQFDSSDLFEWHFPLKADPVFPSAVNTIRWKSSFTSTTAKLEYSIDKGITWQLINPAINLSSGFYNWNAPDYNGKVLLKMQINNLPYLTDTFIMAARTPTGIGFNCPDSFLLYWNKIPAADNYRVYTMGDKYLIPVGTYSTDSFKVFQKTIFPSKYYAVAPLFENREGVKSYTIDYTLQGVECYIRSFLASLVGSSTELKLSLGSLYNINKITLEKKVGNQFLPLDTRINIANLQLDFLDINLTPGINIYRIRIDLSGGGVAYSSFESVFFFRDDTYVIYPNPVLQNAPINIAQLTVEPAVLQVYNSIGMRVYEKTIEDRINIIPANTLAKGVHFIRILKNGHAEKTLKLIVY
ncbi:MAG: S8 family peptidase [Ferruginibacter sp.]